MMLEQFRKQIIEIGIQLKEYKLISLTGGNVSGRDRETGLIAITPSEVVRFEKEMTIIWK